MPIQKSQKDDFVNMYRIILDTSSSRLQVVPSSQSPEKPAVLTELTVGPLGFGNRPIIIGIQLPQPYKDTIN